MTSSAHSPIYIAKKVDVVREIPGFVGTAATIVGEVMLLRPKPGVNPFALAACLRNTKTQAMVRSMIRGQTAHLYADDLRGLALSRQMLERASKMAFLVEEEAKVSDLLVATRRRVLEATDKIAVV